MTDEYTYRTHDQKHDDLDAAFNALVESVRQPESKDFAVTTESPATTTESPSTESPATTTEAAPQVRGEGFSVTLDFPAAQREFAVHGHKVDVSSISKAGLHYLLRLGFSTSLTQCNAGVASAGKEEGLLPQDIDAILVANRKERLQKICDGTIGKRAPVPGGGSWKTRNEKILRDIAWSILTVIYNRSMAELPVGTDRTAAISAYLARPGVRERLAPQVAAKLAWAKRTKALP